MTEMKCPYCDKGSISSKVVKEFHTKLGGIPFTVKDARIGQCDTCGKQAFDAKELKRWEQELKKQLQDTGNLITPEQVKSLRDSIKFSVSDFAALFGVTRQTVYAWEHKDVGGVQFGPVALLLMLLSEEVNGNFQEVYDFLFESSIKRGQKIKAVGRIPKAVNKISSSKHDNLTRIPPKGAPSFCEAA